jgi:hypothetical protein
MLVSTPTATRVADIEAAMMLLEVPLSRYSQADGATAGSLV